MDDVSGQRLGVGMATRGPSFGHRYVDPSPIARHVVDGDAIEGTNLELHDDTLFLSHPCTPVTEPIRFGGISILPSLAKIKVDFICSKKMFYIVMLTSQTSCY